MYLKYFDIHTDIFFSFFQSIIELSSVLSSSNISILCLSASIIPYLALLLEFKKTLNKLLK